MQPATGAACAAIYDAVCKELSINRQRASGLYTSPEACVSEVMERLERAGQSPREERLRLCAIEMSGSGPLKVHAVASAASSPAMSAGNYQRRLATLAATRTCGV